MKQNKTYHVPVLNIHSIPLSEQQIFALQDIFLKPGIHVIHVPSMQLARQIIYRLLSCMHYYHNIACLTYDAQTLEKGVLDLLSYKTITCSSSIDSWDQFFLEYFEVDFVWIEYVPGMIMQLCLNKIQASGVGQNIPVLVCKKAA